MKEGDIMHDLISQIRVSKAEEISEVLDASLARYREIFPEWEVTLFSIHKTMSRSEQIDRMIQLPNSLKASP